MACHAGRLCRIGSLNMASIERKEVVERDRSGRESTVVRYKVRYRDHAGREHSETRRRLVDAERRSLRFRFSWPLDRGAIPVGATCGWRHGRTTGC